VSDGSPPCRVILIGMMGSGKTTVGQLLSGSTGWPYVDNDALVQRLHGRTSREILATEGKETLRAAEAGALALGLDLPPPVILGVAAGTILDAANRRAIQAGGVVVWLRAGTEALVGRAMDAAHRPFVDDAGKAWMADAVIDREPLYASIADLVVDTDVGAPADAVQLIRAHLASVQILRGPGGAGRMT
jgi:shikimate kinase